MKLFREEQGLMKIVLFFIIGMFVLMIGAIVIVLVQMQQDGVEQSSAIWGVFGLSIIIMGFTFALIFKMRLITEIDHKTIEFRIKPFRTTVLQWEEVQQAYVRRYKPVWEYGGWGIRYSFRNGRAYNMSGNVGLQLLMNDGRKILIGTQKGEKLTQILEQHFSEKIQQEGRL